MTQMSMNISCLMNQLLHSTHCLSPIINIDSLILESFSITNSCSHQTHTHTHTPTHTHRHTNPNAQTNTTAHTHIQTVLKQQGSRQKRHTFPNSHSTLSALGVCMLQQGSTLSYVWMPLNKAVLYPAYIHTHAVHMYQSTTLHYIPLLSERRCT